MENKVKRNNMKRTIWSVMGYFIGGSIYVINGGDEPMLSFFSKVIGVLIGLALSDFHTFRKNPKLKAVEKVLQEDERNQVIRDRAAFYTYFAAIVLLLGLSLVGEVRRDFYLTYGSAVFAGLLMLIHKISSWIVSIRT